MTPPAVRSVGVRDKSRCRRYTNLCKNKRGKRGAKCRATESTLCPDLFVLSRLCPEQAKLYDNDDSIALAKRLGAGDEIISLLLPHYAADEG